MISKRIAGRKDGKSSAVQALSYGEGLTPDRETGEVLDKSHRTRLGNFGIVDDGVYAGRDAVEMAEIIELAAIEMQSNCDSNTRVGPDKRLAHFVVSYNQDKPSEAVLRDTEDSMLAATGLDKNHFATFLHNDNGYWHLHIFSSRIEKEKPHKGNDLWHDQINRDKVCREIEIRHGLQHDNGLHQVDEHGQIVEIPRSERIAKRSKKPPGISDPAKKAEIYSGEKSFQTWANEIRIGDRLKHAKSWQDLHTAAAAYGCEVKEKGAGFIICPAGEKGGIQLSKVGLKNLPAKFGAFQSTKPGHQAQTEATYKPEPTNKKATSHYDKWRVSKDAFKPIKTDQINEQREAHKQSRNILRAQHKSELEKIRSGTKGQERVVAVSVAKMEQSIALVALADQLAHDRQTLRKQLAEQGPGNTFRDYLVQEAAKGDDKALALAQRYGADSATDVLRKREADQLQIVAAATGPEDRPAPRINFTHRVDRNGTVVFNLGHGRIVTDSAISKQIQLNSAAATDPAAIETSLRFAVSKFGNTLTLTGSPEFQRLAVETSVRKGLNCNFKDPALEAYKQEFAKSIRTNNQEKKHVPRTQQNPARQIPPAHRRNRLHMLSELTLVSKPAPPEMLLPKDVPGSVADGNVAGRNGGGLRRPDAGAGGRAAPGYTNLPSSGAADASRRTTSDVTGADLRPGTTAGVGLVRSGSGGTGKRTRSTGERVGLSVTSPSNNQQAQRAAAPAAEKALAVQQIDTDQSKAEVAAPVDPIKEWFAANPDMVEYKIPPLFEGRVLHIFDDGRWIQHLGREQVAIRPPVAFKLEADQRVSFDNKYGKASIVQDKGKGRAD